MASARAIKVGTDCSGMEAPIQAMRNLGVKFSHKFSCDILPQARATIEANFPHGQMYHDLTKRNNKEAPSVDIYVAGFPCQPFSSAGVRQGFKDKKGRGKIFFNVLDYLKKQRPRVFVLENVSGITTLLQNKKRPSLGLYMDAILEELESLRTYNIQWQVLDTKEHGVPHSRRRWYCIGIHKDFDNGSFQFPKPIKRPAIEDFLERRDSSLASTGLPPKSQTVSRGNVKRALREAVRKGVDPFKEAFIVDCDSSEERSKSVRGVCPCITVSRAAGHWVTNRGRRLTKEEMMRLQGMNPTKFMQVISDTQLGRQLGNTMSVNVLERLFSRVLPAAKLVPRGKRITDRWAKGTALSILKKTRGKGFKKLDANAKKILAKMSSRKRVSTEEDTKKAAKRRRVR